MHKSEMEGNEIQVAVEDPQRSAQSHEEGNSPVATTLQIMYNYY